MTYLKKKLTCVCLVWLIPFTGCMQAQAEYEPTRQSCARHRQPDWFADAKLGLYAHWGPRSWAFENAPGSGIEWTLKQAYDPNTPCHEWWTESWGDPKDECGMKDVIAQWNPVKFDAVIFSIH